MVCVPCVFLSIFVNVLVNVTSLLLRHAYNCLIFPLHLAYKNPDQGEANAGDPSSYACRFPAMISDWRKKMGLSLPFYFVQLAAFSQDYAEIREAQMAALNLHDVGYAVAIDLGDPQSPFGSIHPRRKQEVGRRLSLSVLGKQYGKDVVTTGPVIRGALASSISNTTILVEYVPGTAEGLHASGTAACEDCCRISPFEVLDANNGTWSRADFIIRGARVELEVKDMKAVAVRYNWEGYPQCAVYNGQGAPDDHVGIAATPFRVDLRRDSLK
jgi:sialate O-acetylesterase